MKSQSKWKGNNLYDKSIIEKLNEWGVKLHEIDNVKSSQAACFNVMYQLSKDENKILLINLLSGIGVNVDDVIPFPSNAKVSDKIYKDEGLVIFEWIGPQKSLISEGNGGGRGFQRTSTDAAIICIIGGKITQLLIEWKFTESYTTIPYINRFSGGKGIERLKRYSQLCAKYRSNNNNLFAIKDDDKWGLADLAYEPYYQLLRYHLLGRESVGLKIGDMKIEDYKIIHLSHSQNISLNLLHDVNLEYCPGLKKYIGGELHNVWKELLSDEEKNRFVGNYWDIALNGLDESDWYSYCHERYIG